MNNEDVKTLLRIFRHESSPGEPTVHKDSLLKELAKALGYKVYDGFESDIRTCIKENKTEDEIINCIKMKLKRRFEPEKPKESPSSGPKNDPVPPRRTPSIKR